MGSIDRDEAFKAWLKHAAARGMARENWGDVVAVIRQNWRLIGDFGHHMVRTIEAGPIHIPPEHTYRTVFGGVAG